VGFYIKNEIIEFPITIMNAYIFTYMKIKKEKIISLFNDVLNHARCNDLKFNIISLLWHDNILKMKGGRMYHKKIRMFSITRRCSFL